MDAPVIELPETDPEVQAVKGQIVDLYRLLEKQPKHVLRLVLDEITSENFVNISLNEYIRNKLQEPSHLLRICKALKETIKPDRPYELKTLVEAINEQNIPASEAEVRRSLWMLIEQRTVKMNNDRQFERIKSVTE